MIGQVVRIPNVSKCLHDVNISPQNVSRCLHDVDIFCDLQTFFRLSCVFAYMIYTFSNKRYDTIRYKTIQYKTRRDKTRQDKTKRHNTTLPRPHTMHRERRFAVSRKKFFSQMAVYPMDGVLHIMVAACDGLVCFRLGGACGGINKRDSERIGGVCLSRRL